MRLTVLIVEDNPLASKALEELCAAHPDLEVIGTAGSLAEAHKMFFKVRPALLFLDIELPDGSGIDFWNDVRPRVAWHTHVVFYTAFDHYVIDALRVQAHDFLVKPVTEEDFSKTIDRYYRKCTEKLLHGNNDGNDGGAENDMLLMVIDNMNNRIVIRPESIVMFHYISERKLWEAMCNNGMNYIMRHGSNAERILGISNNFVQVHKSYIINIMFMDKFEDNRIIFTPPFDTITDVTVSKLHRHELFEHFCLL